MVRIEIGKHLAVDSRVCDGRLIFKGSRIMVSDAVELAAAGYSPEQIAAQFWEIITPEAVSEALKFVQEGVIKELEIQTKTIAL